MTDAYQDTDWKVADYQVYCLDDAVLDRQTQTPFLLRGPQPQQLQTAQYFVCIGAAQTFGRFCQSPYPTLLQERLNLPALNFGRGGAGPSFFSKDNAKLLHYINNAAFVIIQVMSGRSEGNSLFESKGLGTYVRKSNGVQVGCDEAFRELLENSSDKKYIQQIVAETRTNWIHSYKELLEKIRVPKILFWFSVRKPDYIEKYEDLHTLFNEFPQLVNLDMIKQVKKYSDHYVECTSNRGMPHLLADRFTGQLVTVEDKWSGGTWDKNWYYPSPEMHVDAANALDPVCRICLNIKTSPYAKSRFFSFFNRKLK